MRREISRDLGQAVNVKRIGGLMREAALQSRNGDGSGW